MEDDTWQTARDLRNAPELLREWKTLLWQLRMRTSRSCVTLPVFNVLSTYPFNDLNICPNQTPFFLAADMPLSLHESHHIKISCDPMTSSPAPIHEGQRHGYFNDEAMYRLLGLDEGAVPLHAGTYGEAEPGIKPVKLSSLCDKSYDRLLLPFVPKNHWVQHAPISIYEKMQQYTIHLEARRELGRLFSKALVDVQISMKNTGLNLPSYAHHLVLRLLYKAGGDEEPFFYQFLIFFSPSAHRIWAARIRRVCVCSMPCLTWPKPCKGTHTAWNEAYIMLVSCIDYALDMTCIQSVSQCFIVCGIL